MSPDEIQILERLCILDEDGDNDTPLDPNHQSNWTVGKLYAGFSRLPESYTCDVEQIGTSDAFFWGNVFIKNTSSEIVANITLSKFGNLAHLHLVSGQTVPQELRDSLSTALDYCGAFIVPEHIASSTKDPGTQDTWFRRFFDYV